MFGPQWLQIVAFVRRCAVLSGDEVVQSTAAGHDGLDPVWESALNAARKVARDVDGRLAATEAARDAAWQATWGATGTAREATRDAVVALSTRDLIGQHGYTQEHYDELTESWATVIGPVHPDDEMDRP